MNFTYRSIFFIFFSLQSLFCLLLLSQRNRRDSNSSKYPSHRSRNTCFAVLKELGKEPSNHATVLRKSVTCLVSGSTSPSCSQNSISQRNSIFALSLEFSRATSRDRRRLWDYDRPNINDDKRANCLLDFSFKTNDWYEMRRVKKKKKENQSNGQRSSIVPSEFPLKFSHIHLDTFGYFWKIETYPSK